MDDWFHIEKIDDGTYAISEYKHWEKSNSYLLLGSEQAVLIDTGLGVGNIRNVVDELTDLPIRVLTSHVHWDHIGGHNKFSDFSVHDAEKKWISNAFPLPLEVVKHNLALVPCEFPDAFDLHTYKVFHGTPSHILYDGECIDFGGRKLLVIHTPGHSPGHCCFYDPEKQYLFSGDLIYQGCLDIFYPTTDPRLFLQSVKKIRSIPIRRILPGHYSLNISLDIIVRIEKALEELARSGQLTWGMGILNFDDFQIHL